MYLLDLPTELFQRIVAFLAYSVGGAQAWRYRQVCGTFAAEIKEHLLVRHDIKDVFPRNPFDHDRCPMGGHYARERFFAKYGPEIIQKRLPKASDSPSKFIQTLIERLLALKGSSSDAERTQYTTDICNALQGVINVKCLIECLSDETYEQDLTDNYIDAHLPAAAAAVGDIALFESACRKDGYWSNNEDWTFPNPLSAAVASKKIEMVKWILQKFPIVRLSTGEPLVGCDLYPLISFMRHALQAAVRSRSSKAGNLLLDMIFPNVFLYGQAEITKTIEACFIFDSTELFDRLLDLRKLHYLPYHDQDDTDSAPLLSREKKVLLRYGSKDVLLSMLQKGFITPNRPARRLPLDYAVHYLRFDLASLLLDNGADIDAKNTRCFTALHQAAASGYVPSVKFLLANGADPRYGFTSKWDDVLDLCLAAHYAA